MNTLVAKHIGPATISLFSDDPGISMNSKNSNITIESTAANSCDLHVTTHYPNITAARMASNDILELAYSWVCKQPEPRPHNNSVWDLRFNWETRLAVIQSQLLSGEYRLSPLRRYDILGEFISSWAASDALVLKALTLTLQPLFSTASYTHCIHLVDCKIINDLVAQYCQRLETRDGVYYHFTQGIPRGCPLSPLMAALYLKPLDDTLKISKTSRENHHSRLGQRYAQGASAACIGRYIERWTSWCKELLTCCNVESCINSMGLTAYQEPACMVKLKENTNENLYNRYFLETLAGG